MASRSATSLGWTPQRVARVATPLSRCVRVIISGQKYEVSNIRKGGGAISPVASKGHLPIRGHAGVDKENRNQTSIFLDFCI